MATINFAPKNYYYLRYNIYAETGALDSYSFNDLPANASAGTHDGTYDEAIDIGDKDEVGIVDAVCIHFKTDSAITGFLKNISFSCDIQPFRGSVNAVLTDKAPVDNNWHYSIPSGWSFKKEKNIKSSTNRLDFNDVNVNLNNVNNLYLYLQTPSFWNPGETYAVQYSTAWRDGTSVNRTISYIPSYTLTISTDKGNNNNNSVSVTKTANSEVGDDDTWTTDGTYTVYNGDTINITRSSTNGYYVSNKSPEQTSFDVSSNKTISTTFSKEVYNINTELPEGISLTITKNGTSVNTCNYNDTLLISWNYNPSQNRRVEFINCTVSSGNLINNNNQTYNYTVPDLNHNDTITFTAASKQIGGFWVKDSNNNWKIYDIYIMTNNGWKICDPYVCTDIQNNTYTWKMLG